MTISKRYKLYSVLCLILVCVMPLMSCTRNNGDIGEYFGTWKLEKMTIDGAIDTEYEGNMFWKFQSTVFCMQMVDEYHGYESRWGTWRESSKTLILDFTHHDDKESAGATKYSPFEQSHLPSESVVNLTIISMSGSAMQLEYVDNSGRMVIYNLKKW